MLLWGSWANTRKIDQAWRFELFYLDYTFGLLAAAVLFGLAFGRTNATSANSFFINLHAASNRSIPDAIELFQPTNESCPCGSRAEN
jgi:glucose uptake protein